MAIVNRHKTALWFGFDALHQRGLNNRHPLELDTDDVLRMFVAPADRDVLRRAGELVRPRYTSVTLKVALGDVTCRSVIVLNAPRGGAEHLPFCMPYYAGDQLFVPKDDPAMQRISSWLEGRYRFGYEIGLARAVLEELFQRCTTLQQVAFFWPVLQVIAAQRPTAAAKQLTSLMKLGSVPANLPALPAELRKACQVTTALLHRICLLPETANSTPATIASVGFPEQEHRPTPWASQDARSFVKNLKVF